MRTADRQDLHLHSTFSSGDSAVVPQQTVELIASIGHARVVGVSDHLEYVVDDFARYESAVRGAGLRLAVEVNGGEWTRRAAELPVDYFVYHCRDRAEDYAGAAALLRTGKPLVVAHPQVLETNPDRLPPGCLIEINNRYVWQRDGEELFRRCVGRFEFVISSDAHQPHWLNLNAARAVASRLGIRERLLFG